MHVIIIYINVNKKHEIFFLIIDLPQQYGSSLHMK